MYSYYVAELKTHKPLANQISINESKVKMKQHVCLRIWLSVCILILTSFASSYSLHGGSGCILLRFASSAVCKEKSQWPLSSTSPSSPSPQNHGNQNRLGRKCQSEAPSLSPLSKPITVSGWWWFCAEGNNDDDDDYDFNRITIKNAFSVKNIPSQDHPSMKFEEMYLAIWMKCFVKKLQI